MTWRCSFGLSGLPTGWTSTAAGDVDPNQIISMFPCDLKAVGACWASFVGQATQTKKERHPGWPFKRRSSLSLFGFLQACQAADQSRKLGAVSLFTGVAGLELGLSQPEPQQLLVLLIAFKQGLMAI